MSQEDVQNYLDADAEHRRRWQDGDPDSLHLGSAWVGMTREEKALVMREMRQRNDEVREGRKCS